MEFLLYIILITSAFVNILFFYYDFFPFFKNILKEKRKKSTAPTDKDVKAIENEILKTSFDIIEADKQLTTWDKKQYVSEKLYHYIKGTKSDSFKKFHFPVAFLYHGLSSYVLNKNKESDILRFKAVFDKIIDQTGQPKFTMDKPDQVPFGLTALSLYDKFKEAKYLQFSEYIFQFILTNLDHKGIMLYNKSSDNQYVDVLGMIVPFLVSYSKVSGDGDALILAKAQIDFFEKHGVDSETFLPSHSFHLKTFIRTGSVNWGRGFGWYLLGINAVNSVDASYVNKMEKIFSSVPSIGNHIYSQFPGSSQKADLSATMMLLNCFSDSGIITVNKEELINTLQPYVQDGYVMQTSGDTIGINDYSDFFGKSEFSQGMMLLLLSKLK